MKIEVTFYATVFPPENESFKGKECLLSAAVYNIFPAMDAQHLLNEKFTPRFCKLEF